MAKAGEEIKVGAMVVAALVLFLTALVSVGGMNLFRKRVDYFTYFKFAGGLEPGSIVRFGGIKVGVVQSSGIDPQDSTRIRVKIAVNGGVPIRTDSRARISSLGLLGENYLEVSPGSRDAQLLPPGSEITAAESAQMADILNNVNTATTHANTMISNLNSRLVVIADKVDELVSNFNLVMRAENRKRIDAILANIDGALAEDRAPLKATLANVEAASTKLGPVMDNANQTLTQTKTLATNLNSTVVDNRAEIHEVLVNLHTTLLQARQLMGDMQSLLENNRANLDESLENIRVTSQNLRQFTDQVKRQPYSLVRIKAQKDRIPPTGK